MQKRVNAEGNYFEGDTAKDKRFCKYNDLLDQSRLFCVTPRISHCPFLLLNRGCYDPKTLSRKSTPYIPLFLYGGFEPRLVTEWVQVRIPSKTWLYLLWKEVGHSPVVDSCLERKSSSPPLVICWHRHL
ncbi:hypothetical protein TNCV_5065231 [Trichonephila clavipes]|nr:hypothetical protein TNCV_5065231 [Trichonephila clavipes]